MEQAGLETGVCKCTEANGVVGELIIPRPKATQGTGDGDWGFPHEEPQGILISIIPEHWIWV